MLEITLCRHNEIKSRCRKCWTEADIELKRLQDMTDAEYEGAADESAQKRAAGLRSCSDCEAYAPLSAMVEKADGRVICKACQRKLEQMTVDRMQLGFFDQMSLLDGKSL